MSEESARSLSERLLKERSKRRRGPRPKTYEEQKLKRDQKQMRTLARFNQRKAQEPYTRLIGHKTVLTDFRSEENGDSKNSE